MGFILIIIIISILVLATISLILSLLYVKFFGKNKKALYKTILILYILLLCQGLLPFSWVIGDSWYQDLEKMSNPDSILSNTFIISLIIPICLFPIDKTISFFRKNRTLTIKIKNFIKSLYS